MHQFVAIVDSQCFDKAVSLDTFLHAYYVPHARAICSIHHREHVTSVYILHFNLVKFINTFTNSYIR